MTPHRRRLALLAAALALTVGLLHLAAPSPPARVAGLSAPVAITRDRWNVVHLRATGERDLFVAQGYVTAQDRLWQLLLRRQAARGRLSDWLGPAAAEADALLAGQGFYADPAPSLAPGSSPRLQLADLSPDAREALEAYAAGVNAYLAQSKGSRPIEFTLLTWRGVSVTFEDWTVQDSLAVARMVDWAQTLAGPGASVLQWEPEWAADLGECKPAYPLPPRSPAARQALQWAGLPLFSSSALSAAYSAPILPPAWHMVGLHSPLYEAAGAALAGLPGVVAGRGAQRAWSQSWSEDVLWVGRASAPCPACVALAEAELPAVDLNSEPARQLTPYLIALEPQGWLQRRVTPMMAKWDYRLEAASAPAAVYEAWVAALGRRTFADEMAEQVHYAAGGCEPAALAHLAGQPLSPWWDDVTTPQRETRDEMMQLAYADALEYLGRHYGDLHTIWEWGQLHAVTFEHALGGAWPASIWLNHGPVSWGGDGATEPPVPFDISVSFEPVLVPSLVWRVSPTGELSFALAGEPSGLANLVGGRRAWPATDYVPLLWAEADVNKNAGGAQALLP